MTAAAAIATAMATPSIYENTRGEKEAILCHEKEGEGEGEGEGESEERGREREKEREREKGREREKDIGRT